MSKAQWKYPEKEELPEYYEAVLCIARTINYPGEVSVGPRIGCLTARGEGEDRKPGHWFYGARTEAGCAVYGPAPIKWMEIPDYR